MVLIHGYLVDLNYQWVSPGVFHRLALDFHVTAYGNRGHGQSSKFLRIADFGLEMMHDLVRFIDHLGFERVHVVSYSMGAMIVARSLVDHAARLRTVTLGGCADRLPMLTAITKMPR